MTKQRKRHYEYKVEAYLADGTRHAYCHRALRTEARDDAREYIEWNDKVVAATVSRRNGDGYTLVEIFTENNMREGWEVVA